MIQCGRVEIDSEVFRKETVNITRMKELPLL
jgi:hypothetical protein